MASISAIVAEMEAVRRDLLEAIAGLSLRELTQTPVYDDWTIKDVLAHLIGWDRWSIGVLELIRQGRSEEIPGVDVEAHNRASIQQWREHSWAEVAAAVQASHQQLLAIISGMDHIEIDKRHTRQGRVLTVRSYVINTIIDHERQHAVELQQWRRELIRQIDPAAIQTDLARSRADFMASFAGLDEAELTAKEMAGEWSVKDVVGHVLDWEKLLFQTVRHIYDPSQPPVISNNLTIDEWNAMMANRRADQPWAELRRELEETQAELDRFMAQLKPGDWRLRGPYPIFNDRGTLAEAICHIADHYTEHASELKHWRDSRAS